MSGRGRSGRRFRGRGRDRRGRKSQSREGRYAREARLNDKIANPPKIISRMVTRVPAIKSPQPVKCKVRCSYENGGIVFAVLTSGQVYAQIDVGSVYAAFSETTTRGQVAAVFPQLRVHSFKCYAAPGFYPTNVPSDDTNAEYPQMPSGWSAVRVFTNFDRGSLVDDDTSPNYIVTTEVWGGNDERVMVKYAWDARDQQYAFSYEELISNEPPTLARFFAEGALNSVDEGYTPTEHLKRYTVCDIICTLYGNRSLVPGVKEEIVKVSSKRSEERVEDSTPIEDLTELAQELGITIEQPSPVTRHPVPGKRMPTVKEQDQDST